MLELSTTSEGVVIPVIAQPGAKRSQIVKFHAGAVKIAVKEPPDKGRANEAIIELLAEILKMPLRSLELASGGASRKKTILARGADAETIRQRLVQSIE